MKIFQNFRNF